MSARTLSGSVALVTGATSGMGWATAEVLAAAGADVLAVGRREDRLHDLADRVAATGAPGKVVGFAADLSAPGVPARVVTEVVGRFGRLDVVVNAAGVMYSGPTLDALDEEWQSMIDLNFSALAHLSRAAMPHLVEAAATGGRGVADLVNISSLSGRIATAENAVYAATKFAVTGFTDGLRKEFSPKNVRVSVLEPALTRTEIFGHQREAGRTYFEKIREGIEILEPLDVAEVVEFLVTRPRRVGLNEIVMRSIEQV
ncbi:SDR family oxidoreductase [Kineococcus sp. SYSU DK003]|uniref:SDR family oxidoreductase n=1 Tax=Kineococcus sp. SYSU DK003 TaxID=3383124 RepID=UPI003D7C5F93